MMKQRRGLGKGLGTLLPDKEEVKEEKIVTDELSAHISVDSIDVNPFQPRTHFDEEALQELSESIRIQGIIQPITVRQIDGGRYQLISGERRLQASKLANLKKIPAYIRTADEQQMLEMALIENIQRENLNALEVALSYQRLMTECNLKQEELGERVGKKRSTVNNYLRLLKLPAEVQQGLQGNLIGMGHARALLGLEDDKAMEKLYRKTVNEQLSVRKVEELVRAMQMGGDEEPKPKKVSEIRREMLDLQERLAGWFGTKVLVKADAKNKGEIKIPFKSKEELETLLNRLKK
ncbi:ParB/RepB/Spo0J family partition protein [Jiulongibacter sediminis]|uniref:Chromosome partitioning protein ParB n=1 Tax=Jiulongibacter sediminis TaxID=1605367 RepID=A0A0P7BFZ2_9BACT|nr:ParB/RepB/Spo0J family partition protein [Jiulongibacter sediminis]KPM49810.1 chromosome partitioning protein ParB [Jiulongibacter sediminis]TBX26847.1 chromosome partitioning protein ParB [Jiulongibacter sediminis]